MLQSVGCTSAFCAPVGQCHDTSIATRAYLSEDPFVFLSHVPSRDFRPHERSPIHAWKLMWCAPAMRPTCQPHRLHPQLSIHIHQLSTNLFAEEDRPLKTYLKHRKNNHAGLSEDASLQIHDIGDPADFYYQQQGMIRLQATCLFFHVCVHLQSFVKTRALSMNVQVRKKRNMFKQSNGVERLRREWRYVRSLLLRIEFIIITLQNF